MIDKVIIYQILMSIRVDVIWTSRWKSLIFGSMGLR